MGSKMKKENTHFIPSAAIVFLTISTAIFYYFIFIASKITIKELNIFDNNFVNILAAATPSALIAYIVYHWSRSWQRKKTGRDMRLKAVPLVEQIPYMISFVILYIIAVFTADFINTATNVQYFPSRNTGFFLALGFGAAMTVRTWEVFVQHYSREQAQSFRDSANESGVDP